MSKSKLLHSIFFIVLQIVFWPVRWLPFAAIHKLGAFLGTILFYASAKFRKRSLSNLALASALKLEHEDLYRIAKESLENLMITCLEYFKFASLSSVKGVIECENPEQAQELMQ